MNRSIIAIIIIAIIVVVVVVVVECVETSEQLGDDRCASSEQMRRATTFQIRCDVAIGAECARRRPALSRRSAASASQRNCASHATALDCNQSFGAPFSTMSRSSWRARAAFWCASLPSAPHANSNWPSARRFTANVYKTSSFSSSSSIDVCSATQSMHVSLLQNTNSE
jgi:hypothetical protein